MKRFFLLATLMLLLIGCADTQGNIEDNIIPNRTSSVSHTFKNGTAMTVKTEIKPTLSRSNGNGIIQYGITDGFLDADGKRELQSMNIEYFPERVNNVNKDYSDVLFNYSKSFLCVSDGMPYSIMLLYTCYYNCTNDKFCLFWLDEDGNFSVDNSIVIWKETATGSELTKKRNNYYFPVDNEAITFTLPKGTVFGFYFYNTNECGGTYHFTQQPFNTKYNSIDKCDVPSMVTYSQNGYQIIGMDATFPITSSYDADINDIVFALNPPPRFKPENDVEITIKDIKKELYCKVDDFALSNNVERYPEYYNLGGHLGGDLGGKISVSKSDVLKITLSDLDKLVFDNKYKEWTYETWIWLSDMPSEEKYLIGNEQSPDWETYSNDDYKIGVAAYLGISGNNNTPYIHTSIHIRKQ